MRREEGYSILFMYVTQLNTYLRVLLCDTADADADTDLDIDPDVDPTCITFAGSNPNTLKD